VILAIEAGATIEGSVAIGESEETGVVVVAGVVEAIVVVEVSEVSAMGAGSAADRRLSS
jgi:hypothetical protein